MTFAGVEPEQIVSRDARGPVLVSWENRVSLLYDRRVVPQVDSISTMEGESARFCKLQSG
jgi:hypothetical protein